ncbi:glycosyltransferase 1 domain-containing protein 1-like [Procambarus clarkii]|uniref:glycosyltransferase 1 domain-containing protein 1-like n=1 Tax=Procambarus clarkii TaxID=6728 RepID=UPI001E67647D|nr:uncharacterized protein LOC123746001 [Procambarus clarkii]XP_045583070.1 uncharacterized protein LOC123746001 [Procambarus clarkii]XP_045583071.1 uncharacterized protein LOC123746001 [Procambarus clarkii]XP_045583072.1 uncharacterized protein LOC123746001 [Procambarus clarkii]
MEATLKSSGLTDVSPTRSLFPTRPERTRGEPVWQTRPCRSSPAVAGPPILSFGSDKLESESHTPSTKPALGDTLPFLLHRNIMPPKETSEPFKEPSTVMSRGLPPTLPKEPPTTLPKEPPTTLPKEPAITLLMEPPTAPPTILLVGKNKIRETGNASTLARLCRQVEALGWRALDQDPDDLPHLASLQHLVRVNNIVAVVGLHAYRSGRVLLACKEMGLPYLLVFGGTDVYECVKEATKVQLMTQVVLAASHLLAFHSDVRRIVLHTWPLVNPEVISIIPQAVIVDPTPDFEVSSYLRMLDDAHENYLAENKYVTSESSQSPMKEKYISLPLNNSNNFKENQMKENLLTCIFEEKLMQYPAKSNSPLGEISKGTMLDANSQVEKQDLPEKFQPLVVLVAGLRPVKDVLFVVDAWSGWHAARGGCGRFVIVGPTLDPLYASRVYAHAARSSGVRVAPSLAPKECQALIKSATVMVNSSTSESMPSALLEAMMLGTPVLARDIPGNASVVTHGHSGLLFSCPDSFLRGLEALLRHVPLRRALVAAARDLVASRHSLHEERVGLLKVLQRVLK